MEKINIPGKPKRFLKTIKEYGDENTDNWYGFDTLLLLISHYQKEFQEFNFEEPKPLSIYDVLPGVNEATELQIIKFPYRCICGEPMRNYSYIVHKFLLDNDGKPIAIAVGRCCVKKMLKPEDRNKRCVICKKEYRGKYDNCKTCMAKIENEINLVQIKDKVNSENYIIKFGKYMGKNFFDECFQDSIYISAILIKNTKDKNILELKEIINFYLES